MNDVTPQAPTLNVNWLDKAICFVSPEHGAKRLMSRMSLKGMFSVYQAAATNRNAGNTWIASKLSTNSALETDLSTMRERSRTLYRDEAIAASYINSRVTKVVGTGMRPQALIQPGLLLTEQQADELNARIELAFDAWTLQADFSRSLSFTEIVQQIERNWAIDGDVFVRIHIHENYEDALPLSLEVIPADRVQTPPDHLGNKHVRMGVHVSDRGERLGYFVLKSDPHDTLNYSEEYEYVPARNEQGRLQMLQMYDQLFAGQLRGIPAISPVLNHIKDLKDLREAVLIREQVRACFTAFIKKVSSPYDVAQSESSETYRGYRIQDIAPGRVDYLGQNEEVQFADPGNGASEFANFIDRATLTIAAGLNWPYSWLTKDYRRSTYSSERMALIDGGSVVECRQQQLSQRLLTHLWGWIVDLSVQTGKAEIDAVDYLFNRTHYLKHAWIPPGVKWIDPLKDVKANLMAISGNLKTRYNVIAEMGGDPEKVSEQRANEIRWDREWGITPIDETREDPEPTKQQEDGNAS